MGMMIDEHITQLKKLKSFHNGSYGASINFALDIMRRYQQIQEIIKETDDLSTIRCSISFGRIKEVVEDENDNR